MRNDQVLSAQLSAWGQLDLEAVDGVDLLYRVDVHLPLPTAKSDFARSNRPMFALAFAVTIVASGPTLLGS